MRGPRGHNARPVLIVSTKVDVATDAVIRILGKSGTPFIRLNTEEFPYDSRVTLSLGLGLEGLNLVFPDAAGPFRSIWWRRVRSPEKPESMDVNVHDYCIREASDLVSGAAIASRCKIMSEPSKVWAAEHKIYQLVEAKSCGLKVPDTVATNDAREVKRAFHAFDGNMIAKPIRTGFIDLGHQQRAMYTTKLCTEHLEELSNVKWCPVIFQRFIPKDLDIRVTVVDKRIFAAAIDSQADPLATVDWRRTRDPDLPHMPIELPTSIESKIVQLMKRLDLSFGALDFALTPDGRFVFLEVNPSGQWLWLDDRLDLGITQAVADWLSRN